MQTLVLGRFKIKHLCANQQASGFTLLEMMVVLIIIGISFSFMVPNFMKNDEDILKEESMRLVALLDYAADTASSTGHWLSWRTTAAGYRFMQRDDNKDSWQPITSDDVLRERHLPAGLTMAVGDGQQELIKDNGSIKISPTGVQSPFQIELSLGKFKRVVRGNLIGKAEVLNQAPAEDLPINLQTSPAL